MRALVSPASLKGVLAPQDAAAELAVGVTRVAGWEADELPVADGGEGTAAVLVGALGGDWRTAAARDPLGRPLQARFALLADGTAALDAAEAVGLGLLSAEERDPLTASSAGLGELLRAVLAARPCTVLVGVGGTATVDGGEGLLAELPRWPEGVRLRVACDVRNPLLGPRGAARVFAPQKGAGPDAVEELERRLAALTPLRPFALLPGAGAGGGLGAALAALGGELCAGAELVLDAIGFDGHARAAAFVVTGEGTVDATTFEGKAPGAVVGRCRRIGVPCTLFGGRVAAGFAACALSGDPQQAGADLRSLGERLARAAGAAAPA